LDVPKNHFFLRQSLWLSQRRVPIVFPKLLGRFLLALADFAMVNHHIVLVSGAVNSNRSEGKISESAFSPPASSSLGHTTAYARSDDL
jgi:hypothetical protein